MIKDGADIPLESPIVDEKRTFTFEKSKSGYFSLEKKVSIYVHMKDYVSDQSRILVSGRLVQWLTNNGVQSSRTVVAENLVLVSKPVVTVFFFLISVFFLK